MSAGSMKEAGWVWEGIGFDPGVWPTIYGVGEGVTYFGVDGAIYIFHPNNEVGLAKLAHVPKVAAEISKWYWYETKAETGGFTFAQTIDASAQRVVTEAETVSRLSLQFPNVVAAFIDDTHAVALHDEYTPEVPRRIKEAVCSHNPDLELWIVTYTTEFENEYWQHWVDYVDVVNLWVWDHGNLARIDADIETCRETFPDKRIVMGIYIREYGHQIPVPIESLEIELTAIARHLEAGTIAGYDILGNCLIDQHPEQAAFIRDFIHSH